MWSRFPLILLILLYTHVSGALFLLIYGPWQAECRPFFRAYAAASTSGMRVIFSTLLAIMKIPASCLLRAPRWEEEASWHSLFIICSSSHGFSVVESLVFQQSVFTSVPESSDPMAIRLARARALIQEGHLGRA